MSRGGMEGGSKGENDGVARGGIEERKQRACVEGTQPSSGIYYSPLTTARYSCLSSAYRAMHTCPASRNKKYKVHYVYYTSIYMLLVFHTKRVHTNALYTRRDRAETTPSFPLSLNTSLHAQSTGDEMRQCIYTFVWTVHQSENLVL